MRRLYWLVTSFLSRHFKSIALTAVLTAAVLVAIPQLLQRLPTPKPVYRIGRVGQFTTQSLPLDIQRLITSGLTDLNPDGTATPSLALKWDILDDGTRYIFYLDTTRTWHDNRQFQAADVTYKFADVTKNILSSDKIEFKLKEPYAPFPTIASTPIFNRRKILSRLFSGRKSDFIGTGHFRVISVKKRGQYLDYLKLDASDQTRIYRFYPTEAAAILGFKLGQVDQLESIVDPAGLTTWPTVTVASQINTDRYVAVFFNTKDPLLADKNFRQALTYAIPGKSTDSARALSPIHPQSWAFNSQVKPYATDIAKAKDLIAKIKQEDKDFNPTIRLDTSLAYLPLAETIKQAWDDIGVNTQVHVTTGPNPDFQSLLAVHHIPPDPDQYTFWHSTQSTNLTGINNPKIDKLLEDGRKTIDPNDRKLIYLDFQRFLLEESPVAFLFYQTTYTITRK